MPDGPFSISPISFAWPRKIEAQFRIRLSKEDGERVPWLKGLEGSFSCTIKIGSFGQLQFFPKDLEQDAVTKMNSFLSSEPVQSEEHSASWLDFARFSAAS
jgi:hypothetical protein